MLCLIVDTVLDNDKDSADIILKSSDGHSFYAHKNVFGFYSNVFAAASECSEARLDIHSGEDAYSKRELAEPSRLETVSCTETSKILELLLRFIYQDEGFTELGKFDRSTLFELAEASEKYNVWSLKLLLHSHMR